MYALYVQYVSIIIYHYQLSVDCCLCSSGGRMPSRASLPRPLNTGPPVSNAHTTVWYWTPDGVSSMTVMYTDYNRELWCNGSFITNARVSSLITTVCMGLQKVSTYRIINRSY